MKFLETNIPYLNYKPEWSSGVNVEFEYQTDIFTSRNGSEDRRSLRSKPRKSLDFDVLEWDDEAARLAAHSMVQGGAPVYAPYFLDRIPCAPSETGLRIAVIPNWVRHLRWVAAMGPDGKWTPLQVRSAASNTIEFFERITVPYWQICPIEKFILSTDSNISNVTSRVAKGRLVLDQVAGSGTRVFDELHPWAPAATYRRFPVYPFVPNWASNVTRSADRINDEWDMGYGVQDWAFSEKESITTIGFNHLAKNYAETRAASEFFHAMRGRRGSFYTSTWTDDLRILKVDRKNSTITVAGEFAKYVFESSERYQNIAIRGQFGLCFVGILSAAISGGNTVLDLDMTLPDEIQDFEMEKASYLFKSRFASDRFAMSYVTSAVAKFGGSIVSVRDSFGELAIRNTRISIGGQYLTMRGIKPKAEFVPYGVNGAAFNFNGEYVG